MAAKVNARYDDHSCGAAGRAPANKSEQVHSAKAQEQPQAKDSIHHAAAAGAGAQVQAEAVLVYSRESRVLVVPGSDRGASEDMVPESSCQIQASPRG